MQSFNLFHNFAFALYQMHLSQHVTNRQPSYEMWINVINQNICKLYVFSPKDMMGTA